MCDRGFFGWCARTELVNAEDEDGLVDLEAEDLRLDERERLSVDLDEALASLDISVQYDSRHGSWLRCVPCSGRPLGHVSFLRYTIHGARGPGSNVPVAVFFLPKHCTLWVDMMGDCVLVARRVGRGFWRCRRRSEVWDARKCGGRKLLSEPMVAG